MDKIIIRGGRPLRGEIWVSGAKNSALKLMVASLLTEETLRLTNVPLLADITSLANLLEQHGVEIHTVGAAADGGYSGRVLELRTRRIRNTRASYDLVRKMRASVLVLGPILAREGHAEVSLPGGCAIGTRPIDLHLQGLESLGAEIDLAEGYVHARAPNGLVGAEVIFPKVSVGATENLLMAACLARGETRLVNAAREPEIVDLVGCLTKMGAHISGAGSQTIVIEGVERLSGAEHAVTPDRIEAGSYAMAAAITGGEIELIGAKIEQVQAVVDVLEMAGVVVSKTERGLKARRANARLSGVDVTTEPFPGFPTDLQAQLMALMAVAEGNSLITESIFENRFMHVPELCRMGADITANGASALVRGCDKLIGAPVMATDLRASVSLVLAGLAAEGETVVNRVYHLDRGYERVEDKLAACGADIERLQA